MQLKHFAATVLVAIALGSAATVAQAEGDTYTRLQMMRDMDANKDSMITKEEFLDMVSKLWDKKAAQMKTKDGMMTMKQVSQFERFLMTGQGYATN